MLSRGLAVVATADERVEAGDEGPDVRREASLAFEQQALTFDQLALPLDESVEHLLGFEVLLADPEVELGESPFVEAVAFSEEPDHLLA